MNLKRIAANVVMALLFCGVFAAQAQNWPTKPVKINVSQIDPSTPLDITKYYPANYPEKFGIKAGASAVAAGSMFIFQGIHKAVLLSYITSDEVINYNKI